MAILLSLAEIYEYNRLVIFKSIQLINLFNIFYSYFCEVLHAETRIIFLLITPVRTFATTIIAVMIQFAWITIAQIPIIIKQKECKSYWNAQLSWLEMKIFSLYFLLWIYSVNTSIHVYVNQRFFLINSEHSQQQN